MANKKPLSNNYSKNLLEKELENKKSGVFGQFFGRFEGRENFSQEFPWQKKEQRLPQRLEFTVFKHEDYREKHIIPAQIKQLVEEIRKEIMIIKRSKQALITEVEEVEKVMIQTLPAKPGIYHIRFLEMLLSFLKALRAKVGEARTWLAAMKTKKKKRGSLFLHFSKKKGTQYSLSSELQTARGVM